MYFYADKNINNVPSWMIAEYISKNKFRNLILLSFLGSVLCFDHKVKACFPLLAESSEEESDDEIADKDSDVSNLFPGT